MPITRSAERLEFLRDIITGAVEGGTGYWAQVSQYQWIDSMDNDAVRVTVGERVGDEARAVLHRLNDEETDYVAEGAVVDIEVIAKGVNLIIDGKVNVHQSYVDRIKLASRENDAGEIDSGDCDNIVQAGLFGKIIYG